MAMNGWLLAIIILMAINIGINAVAHGKDKQEKYNFWSALIGGGIQFVLIYHAILAGL